MSESFQVMGLRPHSGISKAGKPFKFYAFSGLLTDAEGQVSVGEVVIFEGENRPIPKVELGKTYDLSYTSRVRQGKIEASSPQLVLLK
jgi:hypothetical protein